MDDRVASVIKALKIRAIYVRSSTVEMHDDFEPTIPGINLEVQLRHAASAHRVMGPIAGAVEVLIGMDLEFAARFVLRDPAQLVRGDGSEPIVEPVVACQLAATFSAVYACDKDNVPDEASLAAFASVNGVHNVWPFWREYLHSLSGRVGLAPVTLPLYAIRPKQEEPQVRADASSVSEKPAEPKKKASRRRGT